MCNLDRDEAEMRRLEWEDYTRRLPGPGYAEGDVFADSSEETFC